MAKTQDGWTPYGLEAIRIGHLRRRRILALLVASGLAMLWLFSFQSTTVTQTDVFVNGQRANRVEIEAPEPPKKDGPVTVAIEPGKVTRATADGTGAQESVTRSNAPSFSRAPAIPFGDYALMYGPFALLGLMVWLLGFRRSPRHEVNYGIYKGAMPLEMITASASRQVLTTRAAQGSLFGKRRQDHLPRQALRTTRVPQEDDA